MGVLVVLESGFCIAYMSREVGAFVGNPVGGCAVDRDRDRALLLALLGLTITLALFGLLVGSAVASVIRCS